MTLFFVGKKMLYIMRHGKTDWNALYKLQGRVDIPLNDEGRQMAIEAGKKASNIHFDICYCSPLIRAMETAKLFLQGRDIQIITDERLLEMSFGEYEGLDNCYNHPEWSVYNLFKNPEKYVADKNAETFEQLYNRTGDFLKNVALPLVKDGKDVLIIGHGAMNCSIINQITNTPLKNFWDCGIGNCELKKLM